MTSEAAPNGIGFVLTYLPGILGLFMGVGVSVYIVRLFARLVRAVEKIANSTNGAPSGDDERAQ